MIDPSISNFMSLFISIAQFVGIVLFINGLLGFYKNGQDAQRNPLGAAVTFMLVGAALINADLMYDTTIQTFLGNDAHHRSILAVNAHIEGLNNVASTKKAIFEIVSIEHMQRAASWIYLLGLAAFLRGLFRLSQVGRKPDVTHIGCMGLIAGGSVLMNIVDVLIYVESVMPTLYAGGMS